MSIFALYLRRMEAHLVTDTLGFHPDKKIAHPTAKAIAIPHLRLAVGIRGSSNVLAEMFRILCHTELRNGIDDLIPQAKTLALTAVGLCSERVEEEDTRRLLRTIELVFVGWSEACSTMRAISVGNYVGPGLPERDFTVKPVPMDDIFAAPLVPFQLIKSNRPRVPQDLVRLGIAQKQAVDADPESRGLCGGELLMVSLKPRSLHWSCIHRFEEHAA